ncbi:unnamed protein product [Soboliphyme baturini]|uniref:Uncharacterized protein n=1 Tax=Soboliphyme baturini TaxID=241478 RepID=A0A183ILP0_9BILA|nr:unnamed protein product [Soboliphyme baturini]
MVHPSKEDHYNTVCQNIVMSSEDEPFKQPKKCSLLWKTPIVNDTFVSSQNRLDSTTNSAGQTDRTCAARVTTDDKTVQIGWYYLEACVKRIYKTVTGTDNRRIAGHRLLCLSIDKKVDTGNENLLTSAKPPYCVNCQIDSHRIVGRLFLTQDF